MRSYLIKSLLKNKIFDEFTKKNLDKDIKSYTLEGKEEEEYNQIENEEESKLQINSNNIFEKLEIRLKEKKENKKMNLGLVHPYVYYLNIFIFTIFISGWLLSFLKIESLIINSILISANYIAIISLSILNSIFIIFFFSAGYLMNIDLAISVLMIGLYIYLANEFINLWRVLFKEHDDFLHRTN